MIKKYLEEHYNINKLYSSYLINVDSIDNALREIEGFIEQKILTKGEFKSHPDYMCIEKEDKAKNISIDQIRQMQSFLHNSSVVSGYKIALIYGADKMNLNAANCCLKVLEEPPKNTYLFLVTENAASILPTIISRCAKINHHYDNSERYNIDERFIKPLLKSTSLSDRLLFVKEFASKDRDLWIEFSNSMEKLLTKIIRAIIGSDVNLTLLEKELLSQLNNNSLEYLQIKYDDIKNMINDVNKFDLDLRASTVLLINKFRK